jgi:hypothetical protein
MGRSETQERDVAIMDRALCLSVVLSVVMGLVASLGAGEAIGQPQPGAGVVRAVLLSSTSRLPKGSFRPRRKITRLILAHQSMAAG